MRTCKAREAAGPRGTPSIWWPDHHSQQSRRLKRLRGPHRPPFVSPAGAQLLAAWRQRGSRGELLPAWVSADGGQPRPVLACALKSAVKLRSLTSKDHLNLSGPGVLLPGSWGLPVLFRPFPYPVAPVRTPNSRIWGLKASARTIPLPGRRVGARARPFRRSFCFVGVATPPLSAGLRPTLPRVLPGRDRPTRFPPLSHRFSSAVCASSLPQGGRVVLSFSLASPVN